MSKFFYLTIIFLILESCSNNSFNGTWLSSSTNGPIGVVLIKNNDSTYFTSLDGELISDSLSIHKNAIFQGRDTLMTLQLLNEDLLIAQGKSFQIIFHRIHNFQNCDSAEFIFDFLTKNRIDYHDKYYNFRIHYDSVKSVYEQRKTFFKQRFKYIGYDYAQGFEYGTWKIIKLNGSLILLNPDPLGLFWDNLLITDIYQDSITLKKLKLSWEEKHIADSILNIQGKYYPDFENCSLEKIPNISIEKRDSLISLLSNKVWKLSDIDTMLVSKYGMYSKELNEKFFPKTLTEISYRFEENGDYNIIYDDMHFSGKYLLSPDGNYIELDSLNRSSDYILINHLSDSTLSIEQYVNVMKEKKRYNTLIYNIDLM